MCNDEETQGCVTTVGFLAKSPRQLLLCVRLLIFHCSINAKVIMRAAWEKQANSIWGKVMVGSLTAIIKSLIWPDVTRSPIMLWLGVICGCLLLWCALIWMIYNVLLCVCKCAGTVVRDYWDDTQALLTLTHWLWWFLSLTKTGD